MDLIFPSAEYLPSYAEAVQEYAQHSVDTYGFTDPAECDVLAKFARYRAGTDLPAGRVPQDTYWLVENGKFIGEISIRRSLNDALKLCGGHIGYGVRRSRWGQGYGTAMLRLALKKAREIGLKQVLITCNDDNPGSARVIEKNGGILQDKVFAESDGFRRLCRRYWVQL